MVVHRIVIEMRGRQDHARRADRCGAVRSLQARHRPAPAIPPGVPLLVPPAPVSEVLNRLAVGPAAMLAPPFARRNRIEAESSRQSIG